MKQPKYGALCFSDDIPRNYAFLIRSSVGVYNRNLKNHRLIAQHMIGCWVRFFMSRLIRDCALDMDIGRILYEP